MAELYDKKLTMQDVNKPVKETYLGQAHFAGTGKQGETCRLCKHFVHKDNKAKVVKFRYSGSQATDLMYLQNGRCNYPIMNKADRVFPHAAKSCRLLEYSDNPPIAERPKLRKTGKTKPETEEATK